MILVGASASGKTEVANILCKKYQYKKSVTTTTRLPRIHETNGVEYHFVSKEDFKQLMLEDAFVEVTVYQDNYYGLQRKDLCNNGIVILDPMGVNNVIKQHKELFIVYIKTSRHIREERMIKRGDKQEEITLRLQSDDEVFNSKKIDQIHLEIENDSETLDILSEKIHKAYQEYLKKTYTKKGE